MRNGGSAPGASAGHRRVGARLHSGDVDLCRGRAAKPRVQAAVRHPVLAAPRRGSTTRLQWVTRRAAGRVRSVLRCAAQCRLYGSMECERQPRFRPPARPPALTPLKTSSQPPEPTTAAVATARSRKHERQRLVLRHRMPALSSAIICAEGARSKEGDCRQRKVGRA